MLQQNCGNEKGFFLAEVVPQGNMGIWRQATPIPIPHLVNTFGRYSLFGVESSYKKKYPYHSAIEPPIRLFAIILTKCDTRFKLTVGRDSSQESRGDGRADHFLHFGPLEFRPTANLNLGPVGSRPTWLNLGPSESRSTRISDYLTESRPAWMNLGPSIHLTTQGGGGGLY
jgi:hypothetical protein